MCEEPGCGKAFAEKGKVLRHQATVHEGRRDFCCEEPGCGKAFGDKSTSLPGCGKAFVDKWTALGHQATVHEGRRDFICGVTGCGQAFRDNAIMRRHLTIMHKLESAVSSQQKRPLDGTEILFSHPSHSASPAAETALVVNPKADFPPLTKRYKKISFACYLLNALNCATFATVRS